MPLPCGKIQRAWIALHRRETRAVRYEEARALIVVGLPGSGFGGHPKGESMAVKVAINGFGRIGRLAFRQMFGHEGSEIVAINDLTSPQMLAYLLKYDSTQGNYARTHTVEAGEDNIVVDGKKITIYKEADANNLPWGKLGVDVVLECTGFYTSKAKAQASHQRLQGASTPETVRHTFRPSQPLVHTIHPPLARTHRSFTKSTTTTADRRTEINLHLLAGSLPCTTQTCLRPPMTVRPSLQKTAFSPPPLTLALGPEPLMTHHSTPCSPGDPRLILLTALQRHGWPSVAPVAVLRELRPQTCTCGRPGPICSSSSDLNAQAHRCRPARPDPRAAPQGSIPHLSTRFVARRYLSPRSTLAMTAYAEPFRHLRLHRGHDLVF